MNAAIKSLLTSMLFLCFTAVLFTSCALLPKEKETTTENHSEFTETEAFPVKLQLEEESYIIQSKPRSLAVLSADLAQALEDIGAANIISAVSSDAPKNISVSGAKTCGTTLDPNIEQIIAAKPDWLLVSSEMRQSHMEELKAAGIEVIAFDRPDNTDDIMARYRLLFTLCYGSDGNKKSEDFLNTYQTKLDEAISPAAKYARQSRSKRVVYLADSGYTMATGESFEGRLLEAMGMDNLGEMGSRWRYPEIEREELNPEVIFYDKSMTAEDITESEIYADCAAVQSGSLCQVDFAAVRLGGLPMIDELAKMARAVYPQAYGML